MFDSRLLGLVVVFAPLSLLSFGGGQAIVADIQHQVVGVHDWMSGAEFVDLYAISRASPGPSTLIAALIGYHVAGFLGAVTAALAIYVPSSILVYAATSWWHKHSDSPWRRAIEQGLAPIAVGLIFAGILAVLEASGANWYSLLTTAICGCILYFTKVGSYTLMGAVLVIYLVVFFVLS